ncbi:bifunctional hydroxymethylpyrimidine kinase/phosphomethylpyrimidine kinase [Litoribacter ruber]|uniref:hydroxymethylpyrimidine kinase n=1 Tax=Litoribacter ruber TaxID=702568 RepID=A0AAP2G120_9BACT|nr:MULTISPECIES: bifunctional hydroxymethylpyrimidine kinase/phosphomethylpyrimidine kinase [Litoribacter]MBS9523357.1 bifunctional hydroxymethylpyrimidine kinase/phosphomethylpyrimidine kinase [Litoribacter alkaliphilus]MBT0812517.1 bifunctional hydroxymethylpyrimidine kinase/phosphomethylpyrimidine kinase [Litoribacter ruber]
MKNYLRNKYIPVLTIAGSDSGGGAGIQADLKTFSALGCFGTSAITAITVQNTLGVTAIHSIPPDIIKGQILAVIEDIKPKAIKIGMLDRPEVVDVIVETLKRYPKIPVVFDPVMVATSGDKLIQDETVEALAKKLIPLCKVITPNLDEAEILTGMKITDKDEMEIAGLKLISKGAKAVLLKGGHLAGETVYDVLVKDGNAHLTFDSPKIHTRNVHGTGCTLSSAIAAELAKGHNLEDAVHNAREYIWQAIDQGKDVVTGSGNGPLNHFYNPKKQIKHEI